MSCLCHLFLQLHYTVQFELHKFYTGFTINKSLAKERCETVREMHSNLYIHYKFYILFGVNFISNFQFFFFILFYFYCIFNTHSFYIILLLFCHCIVFKNTSTGPLNNFTMIGIFLIVFDKSNFNTVQVIIIRMTAIINVF